MENNKTTNQNNNSSSEEINSFNELYQELHSVVCGAIKNANNMCTLLNSYRETEQLTELPVYIPEEFPSDEFSTENLIELLNRLVKLSETMPAMAKKLVELQIMDNDFLSQIDENVESMNVFLTSFLNVIEQNS